MTCWPPPELARPAFAARGCADARALHPPATAASLKGLAPPLAAAGAGGVAERLKAHAWKVCRR
jgi:hypothetical protein